MELHRVRTEELPSVHRLLAANGWQDRVGTLKALASLVESSPIADVAVLDGEVIGFVRGLSDGQSNGYLSMVVVAATHRGQGIGRLLVEQAMGRDPKLTWVLRAGREGAAAFFAKLGFERSSMAMERRRT